MTAISTSETQALARVPYMPRKPLPSWKTMEQTLRQWHDDSLTEPEFMWLAVSFEDMADHVARAIASSKQPHYLDVPRFEGTRAQLDGLTVRVAV